MGFENILGYLTNDVLAWAKAGYPLTQIKTITADGLNNIMQSNQLHQVIDVRDAKEIGKNRLEAALNIPLIQLLDQLSSIPNDRLVIPICPSGNRAMVAASLLQKEGWRDLEVPVGGIGAWEARGFGSK
jgi:hydroxyacylglutathione hydrolase